MRGEYHYPEEEGVPCEDTDEVKEDRTSNDQDDIGNQPFNETSDNQDDIGNQPFDETSDDQADIGNQPFDETSDDEDDIVPIESSDSPIWIASETLIYLPEVKPDETPVIRYIFTTRPSSLVHIHQNEEPTWIDISLKKEIVLDVPDKNERKVMIKEEKRNGTGTNNLFNDAKKRRQTEDSQSKKKQKTDGPHMAKKSTFRDFFKSLFSCIRKPKKVEAL
ncbi:uncharacterized protein LOC127718726 [Mytilus californianus]|uniref:uncharacterized protein LOC127718726 n=1 Tax=Mytilus californianus TaxID=6549 RepID=UPI002246DA16|nr:uncharacterized protein LOC127718726 [Mytilus californianus]